MLGCSMNLKPIITAITIVALGTSLPDLFASRTAALASESADNAIGNVTGSNAVNVLLGLGLPWVIGSIYNNANGLGDYKVASGGLGFSVVVFLVCASVCFLTLFIRRACSGELGGSYCCKLISAILMVSLWFMYILLSSLSVYGVIDDPFR